MHAHLHTYTHSTHPHAPLHPHPRNTHRRIARICAGIPRKIVNASQVPALLSQSKDPMNRTVWIAKAFLCWVPVVSSVISVQILCSVVYLQGSSVEWCSISIFRKRSRNVGSGTGFHESAGESESIPVFIAWGAEGRCLFCVWK